MDTTDALDTAAPQYQAVIIVEYDDGRMFPLADEIPKCLLPVGNRRLLSYQLDMLTMSGLAGTYVQTSHYSDQSKFFHYLLR